jgi:hypothetical protein
MVYSWQREECTLVRVSLHSGTHKRPTLSFLYSSTVVQHLKDEYDVNQVPVIYYYFNFRDPSTESCQNFVRSLLYQLLHYLPNVPPEVRQLYSCNAAGRPSTEEMTSCLIMLMKREEEVRILGDAFDECTQWNVLWKFLTRMVKSECPSLRLLFTSRPKREIEDAVNTLGIPSHDLRTVMDGDIKQFIMETLENSAQPICRLPEKAKNLIRESLVCRAGGMYAKHYTFVLLIMLTGISLLGSDGWLCRLTSCPIAQQ